MMGRSGQCLWMVRHPVLRMGPKQVRVELDQACGSEGLTEQLVDRRPHTLDRPSVRLPLRTGLRNRWSLAVLVSLVFVRMPRGLFIVFGLPFGLRGTRWNGYRFTSMS